MWFLLGKRVMRWTEPCIEPNAMSVPWEMRILRVGSICLDLPFMDRGPRLISEVLQTEHRRLGWVNGDGQHDAFAVRKAGQRAKLELQAGFQRNGPPFHQQLEGFVHNDGSRRLRRSIRRTDRGSARDNRTRSAMIEPPPADALPCWPSSWRALSRQARNMNVRSIRQRRPRRSRARIRSTARAASRRGPSLPAATASDWPAG